MASTQEMLTKAIQEAINGGWKPVKKEFEWRVIDTYPAPFLSCMVAIVDTSSFDGDNVIEKKFTINDVIFNHDFAKALWGKQTDTMIVQNNTLNIKQVIDMDGWRYHLQQMVVADDPIAYLGATV